MSFTRVNVCVLEKLRCSTYSLQSARSHCCSQASFRFPVEIRQAPRTAKYAQSVVEHEFRFPQKPFSKIDSRECATRHCWLLPFPKIGPTRTPFTGIDTFPFYCTLIIWSFPAQIFTQSIWTTAARENQHTEYLKNLG